VVIPDQSHDQTGLPNSAQGNELHRLGESAAAEVHRYVTGRLLAHPVVIHRHLTVVVGAGTGQHLVAVEQEDLRLIDLRRLRGEPDRRGRVLLDLVVFMAPPAAATPLRNRVALPTSRL
jgi:hypothetical protein